MKRRSNGGGSLTAGRAYIRRPAGIQERLEAIHLAESGCDVQRSTCRLVLRSGGGRGRRRKGLRAQESTPHSRCAEGDRDAERILTGGVCLMRRDATLKEALHQTWVVQADGQMHEVVLLRVQIVGELFRAEYAGGHLGALVRTVQQHQSHRCVALAIQCHTSRLCTAMCQRSKAGELVAKRTDVERSPAAVIGCVGVRTRVQEQRNRLQAARAHRPVEWSTTASIHRVHIGS
mmetsp:Transcript_19937/g.50637  ORF Transcript_19937/g.50637 Transcript_19937/m.50637 type:complete len:233 (+) Transcript_19937:147-845(+)